MSTNSATELAAVAATQSAVDAMAVVTLSPEKYAAEVYQPFKEKLAAAIDSVRTADYDIKTTAGMGVAVKLRALFRDLRIDADKERKSRKEPITKIGKLLESGFDQVEERITPLEDLFDYDIQVETKRKADEKAAKERAEAERVAGIRALIDAIRIQSVQAVGATSSELAVLLAQAAERVITEAEFATFAGEAQVALETVTQELQAMFDKTKAAEIEAAAVEAARIAAAAALEAQRVENARVAAEQARIANEQAIEARRLADLAAAQEREAADRAAREAANLQAERDAQEAAARAQQAEIDRATAARQAELDAQAAQIAADRQRLVDEQAAAAAAALEGPHAEALIDNAQFDADREIAKALDDDDAIQAAADERHDATHVRIEMTGTQFLMSATGPVFTAFADAPLDEDVTDREIIEDLMAAFGMDWLATIDRLQAIDFAAMRELGGVVA